MSDKHKQINTAYCDYQVTKASKPSRIYAVRGENNKNKIKGIKTTGLSKAMLAKQLSMLI